MKLVLHVGLPKTATTSIQEFMCVNGETLIRKEGIYFKPDDLRYSRQNVILSRALIGPANGIKRFGDVTIPDGQKYIQGLMRDAQGLGCERLILSAEQFSRAGLNINAKESGTVSDLSFLKEIFSEVVVVMSVRRQDEWIESLYNQIIKPPYAKGGLGIDAFIEQAERMRRMDYFYQAEMWSAVFGDENILILPFERGQIEVSPTINFFMSLGVDVSGAVYKSATEVLNPSLSVNSHMILKMVSENNLDSCPDELMRDRLYAYERNHDYDIRYTKFMSCELAENILEHYRESNRMLAKKYLNRDDGVLFYDTEIKQSGRYEGGALFTPDDVVRLFDVGVFDGIKKQALEVINASDDMPNVPAYIVTTNKFTRPFARIVHRWFGE